MMFRRIRNAIVAVTAAIPDRPDTGVTQDAMKLFSSSPTVNGGITLTAKSDDPVMSSLFSNLNDLLYMLPKAVRTVK